ncbi:MAG: enoyl-CoA hydratase/isomerase family protein [Burkholderiales bacterium]|jgi:methylglutaconyl-CoA hydratase|nr:enoyl-CoA hydratase/isomerase family protein [Burkholderiales bacterium]
MSDTIHTHFSHGIATITLNRPELCNAFDDMLIAELTATLTAFGQNSNLRVLVLAAEGGTFSAGADLSLMHHATQFDQHRNFEDALRLARLMQTLERLSVPTIARIQGPAFGGGVGLIACCDLAVASSDAWFRINEVRLGLIPAVIGPYIISKIGISAARRYMLTAERFDSHTALQLGLIHEVKEDAAAIDQQVQSWINELLQNSPHALTAAKRLITSVVHRPIDDAMISDTAHRIAHIRTHEEAREGVAAYLGKRPPSWHINRASKPSVDDALASD